MTLIFNIFVFYTLFNEINCRVINDSFNIFVRISKSYLFPIICLAEMILQVIIIFVGKSAFHIVNDGLTGKQWGICIGFSAITFVVSFIVKFIPIHHFIDNLLSKSEEEEEEENNKEQKEQVEIKKFCNENDFDKIQKKDNENMYIGKNIQLNTQGGKEESPN